MPTIPNASRLGQTLVNSTLGAAMLGAGTAASAAIIQRIAGWYHRNKTDERFNKMVMVSPELGKDPRARLAFQTFNRLNPQLADDPLVASTFVRQVLATDLGGGPAVDPMTAAKLVPQKANVGAAASAVEAVTRGLATGLGKSIATSDMYRVEQEDSQQSQEDRRPAQGQSPQGQPPQMVAVPVPVAAGGLGQGLGPGGGEGPRLGLGLGPGGGQGRGRGI